MARPKQPSQPPRLRCKVCLKEVPSSAKSAEAQSYTYYFCGDSCYTKWKEQAKVLAG